MDIIRVLRIIEYVGPRDLVEKQVAGSIHGTKSVGHSNRDLVHITATTIKEFPEVIGEEKGNE